MKAVQRVKLLQKNRGVYIFCNLRSCFKKRAPDLY